MTPHRIVLSDHHPIGIHITILPTQDDAKAPEPAGAPFEVEAPASPAGVDRYGDIVTGWITRPTPVPPR